jgi:hypothetical protein
MPNHDLVAVWQGDFRSQFVARNVDAATDTMVTASCVNHSPHPDDFSTIETDTIADEAIAKSSSLSSRACPVY